MTQGRTVAAALVSILIAGSHSAAAQTRTGLANSGEFIVSAERLFGVSFAQTTTEAGGGTGTITDSRTTFAFLLAPITPLGSSPYEIPRIGFDVDVVSGFTVGGGIGVASGSGSTRTEVAATGTSTDRDTASATTFVFSPRLGYALRLSSLFTFWPRLGVTYYHVSLTSPSSVTVGTISVTTESSSSGLGLNAEPMFVITPTAHVGFTVMPAIDVPLSGSRSLQRGSLVTEDSMKFFCAGLHFGMLANF